MALKPWQKLAIGGAGSIALGAAMITGWEGRVQVAHWDQYAKIWDICHGHTKGVKPGDTATPAQCDQFLLEDMKDAIVAVDRCIHVPLKEYERGAFVSATFNLGPSVVCGSTLQRLASSGDVMGACLQLTDAKNAKGDYVGWTNAGGKPVQGLRNRRTEERNACLGYFK